MIKRTGRPTLATVYRVEMRDHRDPPQDGGAAAAAIAQLSRPGGLVARGTDLEHGMALFGALVRADSELEHHFGPDGSHRLVLVQVGPVTDSVSAVNR